MCLFIFLVFLRWLPTQVLPAHAQVPSKATKSFCAVRTSPTWMLWCLKKILAFSAQPWNFFWPQFRLLWDRPSRRLRYQDFHQAEPSSAQFVAWEILLQDSNDSYDGSQGHRKPRSGIPGEPSIRAVNFPTAEDVISGITAIDWLS